MTDKINFSYEPALFHQPLCEGLSAWELPLSKEITDLLCKYLTLLGEKNRVMNLTAVTEPVEMTKRHILDSLSLIKQGLVSGGALLDIGSGAGLPGIPLAIADTGLKVTLLDSLQKRVRFLLEAANELELDSVTCLWGRAESFATAPLRESFDYVTARAVAGLDVLAEYSLPYLKVGGIFMPLKAENLEDELSAAKRAISLLGGELVEIQSYTVPGTDALRRIPVIKKVRPTPERFPRKTNFIGKKEIR